MKVKIFVVFAILLVLLTGCKNETDETLSFSVLYNDVEDTPYQSDWEILKKYKELHNVILDIRLGDDENYEEAISLNLNTDSPPDVILKCWPEAIEPYANQGLLVPISDYEHLMPHYTAYIEANNLSDEIEKLRLDNGKYYILPGYQRDIQVQQWIYRADVFELHNLAIPTSYEELYSSLVALKEIYPDSTPITASWGGAHLFSMMGAGYGIPGGWSGVRYYNESEDTWQFAPATTNYREMYQFLNRSYEAGILDPEIFTQSNDDFTEKLVNGKALTTVTWISSGFDIWNEQLVENGIPNGSWEALPVMESTIGLSKLPAVNRFRKGLVISENALDKPYFEDMIEFLDWAIYSQEGLDLTYWGVEGQTYTETVNGKTLDDSVLMNDEGFNMIFNMVENAEFENNKRPYDIAEFLVTSEQNNDTLKLPPTLELSADEIDMVAFIMEDLVQYSNESSTKFITGEFDIESEWDAYITTLEEHGYITLENIWNQAWKRQTD